MDQRRLVKSASPHDDRLGFRAIQLELLGDDRAAEGQLCLGAFDSLCRPAVHSVRLHRADGDAQARQRELDASWEIEVGEPAPGMAATEELIHVGGRQGLGGRGGGAFGVVEDRRPRVRRGG